MSQVSTTQADGIAKRMLATQADALSAQWRTHEEFWVTEHQNTTNDEAVSHRRIADALDNLAADLRA